MLEMSLRTRQLTGPRVLETQSGEQCRSSMLPLSHGRQEGSSPIMEIGLLLRRIAHAMGRLLVTRLTPPRNSLVQRQITQKSPGRSPKLDGPLLVAP